DHPVFRKGLVGILVSAGFDVVGEAENGEDLLALVRAHRPELAFIDIDMPVLDGLSVLRVARDEKLACAFIALSQHDEAATVRAAQLLGARAYLVKDHAVDDVVAAARAAVAGEAWTRAAPPASAVTAPPFERLTHGELRVLTLLADNLTSAQIAERLALSVRTVQNHRAHICDKLELSGTARLLALAIENRALIRAWSER
ncbi:MAG TPA: response regulator transcription factor, partial [Myxococcota bacterium]